MAMEECLMYKVKKPSKRDIADADMRKLHKLWDAGICSREDILNPTEAQMKVLLELGVDMTGIDVEGGDAG